MAQVELNLLLTGKTGAGKSKTGNTILGRSSFKVSGNTASITKEVEEDFVEFENYIVKVIDGPGIKDRAWDAGEDQETTAANMAQAMAMCNGGVDAFLFVYKYGSRFSEEERKALEGLKQIFGEDYFKHLIVVLTMGDTFRGDREYEGKGDITFRDWCRQQTGPFKKLFDDCNGRFILFNNRERNKNAMNKQRQEIIELANQLHKINGRYTSEAFKQAKDLRERFIIKQKVPILTEKIQKKCALLKAELQKYMEKPNRQDKVKIQEMIAATKREIKDQDKGTNLLSHLLVLVERIEENLNDIEQLRELTQKLDTTRKAKTECDKRGKFYTNAELFVSGLGVTVLATVPPLALAAAAIGAGAASYITNDTVKKCQQLSDDENKTKMMQDQIKSRLEKAGFEFNKSK